MFFHQKILPFILSSGELIKTCQLQLWFGQKQNYTENKIIRNTLNTIQAVNSTFVFLMSPAIILSVYISCGIFVCIKQPYHSNGDWKKTIQLQFLTIVVARGNLHLKF